MQAFKTSYKIVTDNASKATLVADIYAWAEANGRSVYHVTNLYLRPELQLAPRLQGFCGPMWDGYKDGVAIVRYEDQSSNDTLSR